MDVEEGVKDQESVVEEESTMILWNAIGPQWKENANFAKFEEGEMLLMAQKCLNTNAKDEVWFLDLGCSNHMVRTKDWLFDGKNKRLVIWMEGKVAK